MKTQAEVTQHFVTFLSPGTFVHEESTVTIPTWDVAKAVEMSKSIKERHNSKPFGFYFSTRERAAGELDSKRTKESGVYFLGGHVMTLAQVEKEMPQEKILNKIVINTNSWKITQPLRKGDTVLDV